ILKMPPKNTSEGTPAEDTSGSRARSPPEPTLADIMAEFRAMREEMRRELKDVRGAQDILDSHIGDMSTRVGIIERGRAPRAPSPETVHPPAPYGAPPVESTLYSQGAPQPTVVTRVLPPHLEALDFSTSRAYVPPKVDFADRSLSQRLVDPGMPESDRIKLLELDFNEQSAKEDRKAENDSLWRAAYEIVRRDNPDASKLDLYRKVKAIVDEQTLKAAVENRPSPSRKHDGPERIISYSGIQRITPLAEDTYDAWSSDLWAYLSSNPKARAMLFGNSRLGYDARLDEELGGLLALTVNNHYKNTTLGDLRKEGETRGTYIFAKLKADVNRDSVSRQRLLRQKMLLLAQKSGESVQDYADRLRAIIAQLGNIDSSLTEHEKVEAFLRGLHPSFNTTRETFDTTQFGTGRVFSLNEVVSHLLTIEEKRSLRVITTSMQPLARFGARQATMEADEEQETGDVNLDTLTEDEAHAYVAKFFNNRSSRPRFGPPSGHPREAEWFAGDCNLCGNPGHRAAHCRLRAQLLDGQGPGHKYEAQSMNKGAVDGKQEAEARIARGEEEIELRTFDGKSVKVLGPSLK
ncbi:unnamed protein product, partial [Tilletia caries]